MRIRYVFVLLMGMSSSVFGATQVKEIVGTYGGNGFFTWSLTETSAYGTSRRRSDLEQSRMLWGGPRQTLEIERTDLDKRWQIDPGKKRYTEESISEANEKMKKEMEKNQQEWEKHKTKSAPPPKDQPAYEIRNVQTKTTGPGPLETLNGFACHAYTVITTMDYASLSDHKILGHQTLYEKEWLTEDPRLKKYYEDLVSYMRTTGAPGLSQTELAQFTDALKAELEKAEKDPSTNPYLSHAAAIAKLKGHPVRNVLGLTIAPTEKPPTESAAPSAGSSKDDSVVEPSDLSGGVSGLVTGIAGRWASKKAESKIEQKMSEHPAWVDELSKDLNGEPVGWGSLSEVQNVAPIDDNADLFNLPIGYKKVKSL